MVTISGFNAALNAWSIPERDSGVRYDALQITTPRKVVTIYNGSKVNREPGVPVTGIWYNQTQIRPNTPGVNFTIGRMKVWLRRLASLNTSAKNISQQIAQNLNESLNESFPSKSKKLPYRLVSK